MTYLESRTKVTETLVSACGSVTGCLASRALRLLQGSYHVPSATSSR